MLEENSNNIPEFDLDRLAQEIDEVFQNTASKEIEAFNNSSSQIVEKRAEELAKIVKEKKKAVRDLLSDIKGELIAEISRGRTEIIVNNTSSIEVEHLSHPKYEAVIKTLLLTKKAMLVGPAGTGKTYMVEDASKKLNLPFYKYSCSRDSSVHDLLGYKQPRSEEYLETTFLKAYENGGIFLVDEYDAMSGDMALFFNGVADNSKFISIPHRDDNPTAKKHKDFYLVMCGNTWGKGSTDYSGRDFQDLALMDRFRFSRHHIGYHLELEKSFAGTENYSLVTNLRNELEKRDSYLSTRNVEDMCILLNSGENKKDIVEMILQDLDKTDRDSILNNLKNLINNVTPEDSWKAATKEVADVEITSGW